jgi:hypothetical protein
MSRPGDIVNDLRNAASICRERGMAITAQVIEDGANELHAALVTVDAHGADLQLPKVRLGYAGHLQALRWIRREPEPQAMLELQTGAADAAALALNGSPVAALGSGETSTAAGFDVLAKERQWGELVPSNADGIEDAEVVDDDAWWAIHSSVVQEMLRRAFHGEDPDLLYVELIANSRIEPVDNDDAW